MRRPLRLAAIGLAMSMKGAVATAAPFDAFGGQWRTEVSCARVTGPAPSRICSVLPDISGLLGPVKSCQAIVRRWRSIALLSTTDAARTETLDMRDNGVMMRLATGETYDAQIDGSKTSYFGDPSITEIRLKSAGPSELIEQHFYNGDLTSILSMRLSREGRRLDMRA